MVRVLSRLARALAPWGRFDAQLVRLVAPFAGYGPPPPLTAITANLRNVDSSSQRFLVANVFAPIWDGVLKQLDLWVAGNVCTSLDGKVDYRLGLADVKCPTLVIGGSEDVSTPPEQSQWLGEHIPGSRVAVISGAPHLANLERPGEWGDLVTGFLADLG